MGVEYTWEPSQQPEPLRSQDLRWVRARDLWSRFGTVEIKDLKRLWDPVPLQSWVELPLSLSPITEV